MHWLETLRDRWRRVWADEPWTPVPEDNALPVAEPSVPEQAVADQADQPIAEPINVERFAERLLQDERARSNLTDQEFQPLLDWALDTLEGVAAEPSPDPTDSVARLETTTSAIREILALVNDAFSDGSGGDAAGKTSRLRSLVDAVGPAVVPPEHVDLVRQRIRQALDSVALEGRPVGEELTRQLAVALSSRPERTEEPSA